MVIRELIKSATAQLRGYDSDNPLFEAHLLIRHIMNLSATELSLQYNSEAGADIQTELQKLMERRADGEPIQYILGTQEFMSLEFKVNPDVLIPRADTETLVEYITEKTKGTGFSLLDIGTGTGCIPLSIAHYNRRAFVRGLDISENAVEIARENALRLNLKDRAAFEICDILTEFPKGKYDIITSNPPYIESSVIETLQTEVKDFEPRLALDGGCDGLKFYRRITDIAPQILNKGGRLVFEIGYNQGKAVSKMMKNNFIDVEVIKDLCGNDRVVSGKLKP